MQAGPQCRVRGAPQPTVLPEERPAEDVAEEFSRRRQERVWAKGDSRPAAPVDAAAGGAPASPPRLSIITGRSPGQPPVARHSHLQSALLQMMSIAYTLR